MSDVKSRREQYSDATRAALIAAATTRFATEGYSATALEDVAADIRATRGAVYHHFGNKRALFEAVMEELAAAAFEQIVRARAGADSPWAGAVAALEAFLDRCMDPVYSRVVWQEGPVALGWRAWQATEQKYAYGQIEEILRDLVGDGEIDPLPLGPATRVVFWALGAAGLGLAEADPAERSALRADYAEVARRLLVGLRSAADPV
ncbi:TetR/AcrR family transcriptional regulator [Actinokineospora spheciospongiae]|uniref:TetR/AcrR family transcriptional regulator n=1 Tax=Actinokineospora spheciospongiae TaxID=909613 RepID=UPI000D712678|nr:TetR/AcrR family transcriptional regulator [Actinokineospora spheciospongiae]PWW56090.1 TetR family transcriptional regulator [Actinokineospora spheciospongiae]